MIKGAVTEAYFLRTSDPAMYNNYLPKYNRDLDYMKILGPTMRALFQAYKYKKFSSQTSWLIYRHTHTYFI